MRLQFCLKSFIIMWWNFMACPNQLSLTKTLSLWALFGENCSNSIEWISSSARLITRKLTGRQKSKPMSRDVSSLCSVGFPNHLEELALFSRTVVQLLLPHFHWLFSIQSIVWVWTKCGGNSNCVIVYFNFSFRIGWEQGTSSTISETTSGSCT